MGFLLSVFKGIHTTMKLKNKVANGKKNKFSFFPVIRDFIVTYILYFFIILVVMGGAIYSVTYALTDAFQWFKNLGKGESIEEIYGSLDNLTDEELADFENTIAYLHPQKLKKYLEVEMGSIPSSITGTLSTNKNGNITKESMVLDISSISNQYKLPWQFVGSIDLVLFKGKDLLDTSVISASSTVKANFTWAEDVSRDVTDYWKEWDVEKKVDPKLGTTILRDGENSAKEQFIEVNTPLGMAEKVDTMFGIYTYPINRDIIVKNEGYCKPYVISEELYKTEEVFDHFEPDYSKPIYEEVVKEVDGEEIIEKVLVGYEDKAVYRTVNYYRTRYKKTKQKIVEDRVGEPTFVFNPERFIRYINSVGIKVSDLYILKETLMNLPENNHLIDMLDRIINGSYGDLDTSIGGIIGGISGGVGISGINSIPIFYQYDERWANLPYASETIKAAGCAPTSMAMVVTGLMGDISGIDTNGDGVLDPAESAAWSTNHGYAVAYQGTSNAFIDALASATGLSSKQTNNQNEVYQALSQGKVVICNVRPGTIINGHHFLVLTGVDSDGKVRMNDPYSESNTKAQWDMNTIAREAKAYWIIDNPNLSYTSKFILQIRQGAINTYEKYGVLPSITMSQAIEESGWGRSALATLANNLFGIKADPSWTGKVVYMQTGENFSDVITAGFRAYDSWADSIEDHGKFIAENPRYAQHGFFTATDYKGQALALQNAGYATLADANGNKIYAKHLCNIIESYKLHAYDPK